MLIQFHPDPDTKGSLTSFELTFVFYSRHSNSLKGDEPQTQDKLY